MKKEMWTVISIAAIAGSFLGLILLITIGAGGSDNSITGHAIKSTRSEKSCEATICIKDDKSRIYCPDEYDTCKDRYDECVLIPCDTVQEEEDTAPSWKPVESWDQEPDEEGCTADMNNCIDDGEEIICKGSFEACSDAFDSCTCGTEDETGGEELEADFDSTQETGCDTGVFVCERTQLSMSGDIATSRVTCKGSFQECTMQYGKCECGDSSLTDFPTKYIGGVTDDGTSTSANNYWCEYNGRQVPCNMLPDNCTKKKNTCNKGDDIWITCDGSFEYCEKTYEECLCGVEIISSGFMTPSSE